MIFLDLNQKKSFQWIFGFRRQKIHETKQQFFHTQGVLAILILRINVHGVQPTCLRMFELRTERDRKQDIERDLLLLIAVVQTVR